MEGEKVQPSVLHPVCTHMDPLPGCASQQIPKLQNGFHVLSALSSAECRAMLSWPHERVWRKVFTDSVCSDGDDGEGVGDVGDDCDDGGDDVYHLLRACTMLGAE